MPTFVSMKKITLFLAITFSLLSTYSKAQHSMSMDAGYIKNFHNDLNGANLSSVFYFNKKWGLAFEINRFFPAKKMVNNEESELSALDFDLNLHRYFPVSEKINFYPIGGISHTSEKELNLVSKDEVLTNFFSVNTGAGFVFELSKKWHPAIEFSYAWGKINQQFLLATIAYEFEGKK